MSDYFRRGESKKLRSPIDSLCYTHYAFCPKIFTRYFEISKFILCFSVTLLASFFFSQISILAALYPWLSNYLNLSHSNDIL